MTTSNEKTPGAATPDVITINKFGALLREVDDQFGDSVRVHTKGPCLECSHNHVSPKRVVGHRVADMCRKFFRRRVRT